MSEHHANTVSNYETPSTPAVPTYRTAYPDAACLDTPAAPPAESTTALLREGLLLNENVYHAMAWSPGLRGRGWRVLLTITLIVAGATLIGALLDWTTSPRLGELQSDLYTGITEQGFYKSWVSASPGFEQKFQQWYDAGLTGFRLLGGYPTVGGTIGMVVWNIAGAFLNWLVYGLVAHGFARWFGGKASLKQFLDPLALSYAPLLMLVVAIIPGASVPVLLLFLYLFATKFLAVRMTYGLSNFSSLAVTALPYVLLTLLTFAVVLFGAAAYGGQSEFLDAILRFLRSLRII